MAKVQFEESSFDTVPEDVYFMKCKGYQEGQGKYGPVFNWKFEIIDQRPELNGKIVGGQTGQKLTPKSRLFEFLKGMGVGDIGPGTVIDLDRFSIPGQEVVVKGSITNTPDGKYSNVDKLFPKKAQPVQQPPQPVQQPPQPVQQPPQPVQQPVNPQQLYATPASQPQAQSQKPPVVQEDWDEYQ